MWISLLTLSGILISFGWWSSQMKAREIAGAHAKKLCETEHVQWVDETVHLKRIRPERNASGRLAWRREYQFDYSPNGTERYRGRIILRGHQLVLARLDTLRNDPTPTPRPAHVIPFPKRDARNDHAN